jgi:hypothetical protein
MKKIKMLAWLLPVLAIAVFVTLQSFQHKEPTQQLYGGDPEWFTYPTNGTDETDPSQYTYAPLFDPEESGCDDGPDMCAVKAVRNTGNNQPILNLNGSETEVEEGGTVEVILRRE